MEIKVPTNDLSLGKTNVTDMGLTHLEAVKSLKSLSLSGCNVSEEGVARLRLALDDCRVVTEPAKARRRPTTKEGMMEFLTQDMIPERT